MSNEKRRAQDVEQYRKDFQSEMKSAIREVLAETPSVERKSIYKEAIQEWLDEKYAAFGKWSINGLLAAALAALGYFLAVKSGWIPPK